LEIEDMLKSGRLPALVATSSLELGIDMGAIDLVVQVESPKSVAAGLQRVATTALDDWTVDELYELSTRAYPYRDLSRAQFEGVLDMLAGRYPSEEFAELRPRIVWDRTAGVVR